MEESHCDQIKNETKQPKTDENFAEFLNIKDIENVNNFIPKI